MTLRQETINELLGTCESKHYQRTQRIVDLILRKMDLWKKDDSGHPRYIKILSGVCSSHNLDQIGSLSGIQGPFLGTAEYRLWWWYSLRGNS